jgi:transposase
MTWRGLTDRQWEEVSKHLPPRKPAPKGGRPWADDRDCFEGILWILWTGAQWSELPPRYGKKSTVHLRLGRWTKDGTLEKLWRAFLAQLNERGHVRWDECFLDGTFFSAKKGGSKSARPREGRDLLVDGRGAPLGVHLDSASPAKVKLAEVTLETVKVGRLGRGRPRSRPKRVIADKA